ncbi:MAG TPA: precorrin-6y C5,15-methyltransferase (decarboxylating) subunit CbiE [Polyangiaceae bacterium]|nr:precorrin-6y C5,15-methyltransferase (decarboxylating) subunit CbiE [Polyangiaceae bacterium]
MNARKAVVVIGLGDDGCSSLSSRAASAIARAQVLVGGERHLAFFPQFKGERIVLKAGIDAALARVATLADEHTVCVLASGDPLFFGIGARVAKAVGGEHIEFLPAPTSVQWAFAHTGIAWDDAALLSVHGRSLAGFCAQLRSARKVAVLTDGENSPPRLAARMLEHAELGWQAWVCERLSGPEQRVRPFSLRELAEARDVDPLNVLLLLRTDDAWRAPPVIPYLPEQEFAKRMPKLGLITKREVRLLSLAALQIRPDSVVWDIGTGSGSVAVEAAMLAPRGKVFAIEIDPEGVAICGENVRAHGVDNVRVIAGRAPEALEGLDAPDAVFVGGSKGSMTPIVDAALTALRPGGRLVINAITLENVTEGYAALKARGAEPEVTLVQISRGAPLAHYQRYEALNPIHILAAAKPDAEVSS